MACLAFFAGATTLVYQMLWLRLLGLVFGVAVHAAAAVLTTSMAGLAIGSYGGGRLARRAQRPLIWFGAAEALVAVTAIGTPAAVGVLQEIHGSIPQSPGAQTLAPFVIAFAVLILPTMLMGAALPLVVKSSLCRCALAGPRAAVLYASNTAGAIAGTLAAGLWLMPALGMRSSFSVAAATNLLVAAAAVLVGGTTAPYMRATHPGREASGDRLPPALGRGVLAISAVSGFALLALEVIWFRVNVLILRPTVYTFTAMLAAVLAGCAMGGAAMAPIVARRRWTVLALSVLELLAAAAALASFRALTAAADLGAAAAWFLPFVRPPAVSLAATAAVTMLPTSMLMGMAFAHGLHLWTGRTIDPACAARRVATFHSANVCGAILGSLVAGFVLLPAVGSRLAVMIVAAAVASAALLLLALDRQAPLLRRAVVAVAGPALLVAIPVPDPFAAVLEQRFPGHSIIWRHEGVAATVTVHRVAGRRMLYLDGTLQAASDEATVRMHRLIAHLGAMIHPAPRDALVIGLGGGTTADAISRHPWMNTAIVERSRAVIRGAPHFSGTNHDLLRRPGVTVQRDDARGHLIRHPRRYDIVTADVVQPMYAGSSDLYSKEYFQLVRRSLRAEGLAVQWVTGTAGEYTAIMRTFLSVFPDATLWAEGSIMIGSRQPIRLARGSFARRLEAPPIRDALAAVGIGRFEDLLRLYTAGPEEMRAFARTGPVITDDRPMLEYFLARPREPLRRAMPRGDARAILARTQ